MPISTSKRCWSALPESLSTYSSSQLPQNPSIPVAPPSSPRIPQYLWLLSALPVSLSASDFSQNFSPHPPTVILYFPSFSSLYNLIHFGYMLSLAPRAPLVPTCSLGSLSLLFLSYNPLPLLSWPSSVCWLTSLWTSSSQLVGCDPHRGHLSYILHIMCLYYNS